MKIKNLSLLFVIGLFLVGCQSYQQTSSSDSSKIMEDSSEGKIVVTITDAAADINSVSSILVTIDNIEAHSSAKGWVTLSSDAKTYDLLELKSEDKAALLAEADVEEDSYDQIRLDISKVIVVDENGPNEAKLPSGEFKINTGLDVNKNEISTVNFDFKADESLHITGNGKYILAPVAEVETKNNAQVDIRSDNDVEISGGQTISKTKVGMDIDGNVGINIKVPASAKLSIDGSLIKIESDGEMESKAKGKIVIGITDAAADMGTINKIEVTVDEISAHSKTEGWIILSSEDMTYDLIELRSGDKVRLVFNGEVKEDNYDQIRLDIKDVIITDDEGKHTAKLPSGQIKIMQNFMVESDTTTAITFDFEASDSLHTTGEGTYIFAPVIRLKTNEDASVTMNSDNQISVEGGKKKETKVGMDVSGNVKLGVQIPANADLTVEGGKIKIKSINRVYIGSSY